MHTVGCIVHILNPKFLYSENASETIKKINDENIVLVLTTFLNAELLEMQNVLLTGSVLLNPEFNGSFQKANRPSSQKKL